MTTPDPPPPEPIDGDPVALLEAVRRALRDNDVPHADAGVDLLERVASPRMRERVGDGASFRRALHSPRYAPLLGHRRLEAGELERIGDSARQLWRVWGAGGETAAFTVAVAVQRYGEGAGRWRVSGIAREGIDL